MSKIRTRFAPSPTGYLHIGGVRTALFSWLFAKHSQGEYVLRVEDTDLERSTPEATQAILDGLTWLGLSSDIEPEFQTKRFDLYNKKAQQLLNNGHAYKCYCTKERLDALRNEQMEKGEKAKYDGHCLKPENQVQSDDTPYVIRFNNPKDGSIVLSDLVYGDITVNNEELDDLIIQRTDGSPTYNFTVVVDDADMEISHVIRGDDHVNNTFRQINIYQALGAKLPKFAHLPMINGDDGKKLSKRHGAVSVLEYRDLGYIPQALLNYLVRLGWSHGDQEIFSMEEMIKHFDLNNISKSSASFNTEKLNWLNQHYIKSMPGVENASLFAECLKARNIDCEDMDYLGHVIDIYAEKANTFKEMATITEFLFISDDKITYDEKAIKKNIKDNSVSILKNLQIVMNNISEWSIDSIGSAINNYAKENKLKFPQVAQPLRIAATGSTQSPSIDQTLYLLGKENTVSRINKLIDFIEV